MTMLQPDYFTGYRSLKMTREGHGVLVVEFHTNGKSLILTGAGGDFIADIDFSSFGDVADPVVWSRVHDEGVQILENLANIRVPLIAAVEGRANVHSEYALLVTGSKRDRFCGRAGAVRELANLLPSRAKRIVGERIEDVPIGVPMTVQKWRSPHETN